MHSVSRIKASIRLQRVNTKLRAQVRIKLQGSTIQYTTLSNIQNFEFLVDFNNFIKVYHDFMGDTFSGSTTHGLNLGINGDNYNATMDLSPISYAYAIVYWLVCDIIFMDSWLTHGCPTRFYIAFFRFIQVYISFLGYIRVCGDIFT